MLRIHVRRTDAALGIQPRNFSNCANNMVQTSYLAIYGGAKE